jgi:xanthine dehydrogenase accessory factor
MISDELSRRTHQLSADRMPFVLATVVRAHRPTSVRPGDCAIVLADGSIEGFVGGMCAESSVRLHGLRVLETGEPLLLRLDPGAPDGGERSDPVDGAVVEHNPCLSGGSLEIFLDPKLPAPRVAVLGSSPTALAIERLAEAAGYEVARGPADQLSIAGNAAVIVASHGSDEERALAEALKAGIPYVALVASHKRGTAVRAELEVPDELREQLHTPAGLKIGAGSPAEIAVAILAELIAVLRRDPPRPVVQSPSPALAIDPVCGMEVAVSEAAPSLDLAGERMYFCGTGCRDAFAKLHAGDVAG